MELSAENNYANTTNPICRHLTKFKTNSVMLIKEFIKFAITSVFINFEMQF